MPFDSCLQLRELYQTREVIGRSGRRFDGLGGLSTINNLKVLRKLMLEVKPTKTLEIGLACGGSALAIAATHRDLGLVPRKQHVAIDGFQEQYDYVGLLQLEKAGLANYVDFRGALSCYELARLADSGETFGLVYIDGSHQFEDVFCDFYFVQRLTVVGSIILFDDSFDPDVTKVVRFIQRNLADFYEHIPVSQYRDFSVVSRLAYTLAERLNKTQLTVFRKIKDGDRRRQRLRHF